MGLFLYSGGVRCILLAGHFPPEVSRIMEDQFAALLEKLGYRILRKRDPKSGLDIIAQFNGGPIPKPKNRCALLRPVFSPDGTTAFSLKRGNFRESDVAELLGKVKKVAGTDGDKTLRELQGQVMVTNYSKTESEVDRLFSRSVYCWDIRRLIFYSAKARVTRDLATRGPVREVRTERGIKASYLIETDEKIGSAAIKINIVVFLDDHNPDTSLGGDITKRVLGEIYSKTLEEIVQTTDLDVFATLSIHNLGILDGPLVRGAYHDYAGDSALHPRVTFAAVPNIFEYGAAPWATVLNL